MDHRTQPDPAQPSPRALAVRAAAATVNAHTTAPNSCTLHRMQSAVQDALNLGATLHDIRDARPAVAA